MDFSIFSTKVCEKNEYHMLAHLIINKVDDFGTILAQSVHEDVVLYILVLCHISKLTNTYSYSMNAPLSLFCFCHVC